MVEAAHRKQVAEDLKKLNAAAARDDRKLDITLLRRSARLAGAIKHVPEALLDSQLAIKFTAHGKKHTSYMHILDFEIHSSCVTSRH